MEARESLVGKKDELVGWCTREWHQDVAVLLRVVEVAIQPQISVGQDAPLFVQYLEHVARFENNFEVRLNQDEKRITLERPLFQ